MALELPLSRQSSDADAWYLSGAFPGGCQEHTGQADPFLPARSPHWIRRAEPVENDGAGPQVRQISNAYGFGMPSEAAAWVERSQCKGPLPDDEIARHGMHDAELKAMLSQASLVEVVDYHTDDPILAGILKRMSSSPNLK